MKPDCRVRWIVLACAIVALIAKIYCADTTIGTTDTFLFHGYAKIINVRGLLSLYRETPMFNHTPLVGEFIAAAWRIENATEGVVAFPFLLRLPGIVCDFLAVLLLLWLRTRTGTPPAWALALFAASPVAFMISGYHGNVDSVLAFALLVATCFCIAPRPLACGIALGLACNIKIVALLVSPVFFFYWLHRRRAVPFAAGAIGATLAGWSVPLLTIPQIFLKNVLGYGGYWGDWGITFLLMKTGRPEFQQTGFLDLSPAQHMVFTLLKLVIFTSVIALAWRRRAAEGRELFTTLAVVWAIMFVFAPGGAPQYLVWLAPAVLLFSSCWYLALTATSTAFLFVFYQAINLDPQRHIARHLPWYQGFSTSGLAPIWRPWTLLPWAVLVALLAVHFWPALRGVKQQPPSAES